MIIAVDFDGTIVEHDYPNIGAELPFATATLKKLQSEQFHRLILWTIRTGKELDEAVEFCRSKGLIFYAHNCNYPGEELDENTSRKVNADMFIDDRNVGGMMDWGVIYRHVTNPNSAVDYYDAEKKRKKKGFFAHVAEYFTQK